jgi:hypothetical protein
MPAAGAGVVVTDIVGVPAKNHVAKAHAFVQSFQKLAAVQDFTPQNAIDVDNGVFYFVAGECVKGTGNVLTGHGTGFGGKIKKSLESNLTNAYG